MTKQLLGAYLLSVARVIVLQRFGSLRFSGLGCEMWWNSPVSRSLQTEMGRAPILCDGISDFREAHG